MHHFQMHPWLDGVHRQWIIMYRKDCDGKAKSPWMGSKAATSPAPGKILFSVTADTAGARSDWKIVFHESKEIDSLNRSKIRHSLTTC
jgi:hypothetical protein